MFIKRYFIALLLFIPMHTGAAHEKENNEFTEIKQLKDLIPFGGKIVAFKGGLMKTSYYPLASSQQIFAGYVWLRQVHAYGNYRFVDEIEFNLDPLFEKDKTQRGSDVNENYLKKNVLSLRLATEKEKKEIEEARKAGKATFGYYDKLSPSAAYTETVVINRSA